MPQGARVRRQRTVFTGNIAPADLWNDTHVEVEQETNLAYLGDEPGALVVSVSPDWDAGGQEQADARASAAVVGTLQVATIDPPGNPSAFRFKPAPNPAGRRPQWTQLAEIEHEAYLHAQFLGGTYGS